MKSQMIKSGTREYAYGDYTITYVGGRHSQRGWEARSTKEMKRYHTPIWATKEEAAEYVDGITSNKGNE